MEFCSCYNNGEGREHLDQDILKDRWIAEADHDQLSYADDFLHPVGHAMSYRFPCSTP